MAEARVAQIAATEARERAAAAVLVQGYVAELLPSVLAGLRDQGYLMERIERGQSRARRYTRRTERLSPNIHLLITRYLWLAFTGIDEEFMPWLVEEVSREIESLITSRDVIIGNKRYSI